MKFSSLGVNKYPLFMNVGMKGPFCWHNLGKQKLKNAEVHVT